MNNRHLIGIAGGSCSGKGYLCKHIVSSLLPSVCLVVPMDAYYKDLSHVAPHERNLFNFDVPDALDHDLLIEHLSILISGGSVDLPVYEFSTHTRSKESKKINAEGNIILVEGLFALYWEELRQLLSAKIFIDIGSVHCLKRRVVRDIIERGRTKKSVVQQFNQSVLPMYHSYVAPTRQFADMVLPGDSPVEELTNIVAQIIKKIY